MSKFLSAIILEKIDHLNDATNDFILETEEEEIVIYKLILDILDKTKRDGNSISLNDYNLNLYLESRNEITDIVMKSKYSDAVKKFDKSLVDQIEINNKYFNEITNGDYKQSKENKDILNTYSNAFKKSVFHKEAVGSIFSSGIVEIYKKSILNHGSYSDLVEKIRDYVVGTKSRKGKLSSAMGDIALKTIHELDRIYSVNLATKNKIYFFRYTGGLIETSRLFCKKRDEKYYHKKEIENWGKLKEYNGVKFVKMKPWDGMYAGTNSTNIFLNLGGVNCRHILLPVPMDAVPDSDINRCVELGFIKLSDKKKKALKVL